MSLVKKRKDCKSDIDSGIKPQEHLGQCADCGHLGLTNVACKFCGEKMFILEDYSETNPIERGVWFLGKQLCVECNYVVEYRGEDLDCIKCMHSGIKSTMVEIEEPELQQLKNQKYLPQCAQPHFNKCKECFDFATYFERQFPCKFLMASEILQVTRQYEKLVDLGFKVYLDENQKFQSKLFFEPTSLDITPIKLRNLIQHHDKFCLCSICKFWIIAHVKQTEL